MSENDQTDQKKKLSPKQLKAMNALLQGQNYTTAAIAAGVTDRTLARWRHEDENFAAILQENKVAYVDHATVRLIGSADLAIDTLREFLQSDDASDNTRLKAANSLLGYAIKIVEVRELQERLEVLEDRLKMISIYAERQGQR